MPVNSGIPVNSSADDLWYIPEQGGKPGLMVSNRLGSQHHAGETCCYDLYLHRKLKERLPAYRPDSLTLARQRAAEQLNALLPLNLYFDNDQPDPASLNDTTSSNYLDLLLRYINRQAVFEKAYSSGLTAGLALAARDSVSTFFMDEIRSAAEQWDSLLAFLEHQLQNGFSINLVLRAYASPLNTPEYNAALASRRAASVRNELRRWNNGRLLPYLDSGNALAVVEIPVGERTSAGSISDDPSDTRNSVYSPAASRERRVSILYGTVDGFTGLWGGAPTTISIFPTEKFPDQLEEGEREVVRLRLQNDGSTSFHCRAIYSGHPQTEAVISERRLAPGGQTDIFILLKGPMNLKDTRIRLSITGNLYQNPFEIMFPME
ncbi:MAG: hypothetical protein IH599_07760 [Bacteroidales bacterium]|nr:hypothetical protein [Bacteroidales bacterium]